MPERAFVARRFLPLKLYDKVVDSRVRDPALPARVLAARARRRSLTKDGRLTLLAADHPARMVTQIRADPLGMGRRHELLSRVLRVIACSSFDGLLSTADVLDELCIIQGLAGSPRFLDRKVFIGSVNRGGLQGSVSELDDGITAYDVEGIVKMRLDGAKLLLRFDPDDEGSAKTLGYCVDVIRACGARKIPVFLEPLPVVKRDGKVSTDADKGKLVRLVGVASALGSSSARVWLKLPYCEGFQDVAAATTLPILLLGGEAANDVSGLLGEIESAMKSGPNVRGVLMGRNLLYPPGGDPLPLAMAVHSVVHDGKGAKEAEVAMPQWESKALDYFGSND